MRIITLKNRCNLLKNYSAITIGCIIIILDYKFRNDKITINHEMIHCEQYKETLYIGFLIVYLLSFIYNIIKYRNWDKAYRNIIFEKEAYKYESNLNYLDIRKHYNWINYLKLIKK